MLFLSCTVSGVFPRCYRERPQRTSGDESWAPVSREVVEELGHVYGSRPIRSAPHDQPVHVSGSRLRQPVCLVVDLTPPFVFPPPLWMMTRPVCRTRMRRRQQSLQGGHGRHHGEGQASHVVKRGPRGRSVGLLPTHALLRSSFLSRGRWASPPDKPDGPGQPAHRCPPSRAAPCSKGSRVLRPDLIKAVRGGGRRASRSL